MAEIQLGATVRADDRARWRRSALALAWATIAWNSLEAVVAIASGAEAGSIALVAALAVRERREAWRGDVCCDAC